MNKSQPIPFSEIIIEAGMVKAFWWIIQEHEKEKQEHTTFMDDEDDFSQLKTVAQ